MWYGMIYCLIANKWYVFFVLQISPATATVSLNGQTELRCMTSSSNDGPHSITWYKDGRVMAGRAQRDVLRLVSVSRSDCGVYQCLVRRGDGETAQSAATVRLGGEYEGAARAPGNRKCANRRKPNLKFQFDRFYLSLKISFQRTFGIFYSFFLKQTERLGKSSVYESSSRTSALL